jgi:endonuclease/exonuclease/phosphatase (EEP) superfamily protein YafD
VRLSVVTFNLGNGMADPRQVHLLLERTDADVVGLQELAADQADALAGRYPHQVLIGSGFTGKGLLSRYPILLHEQMMLYPERPDLRAVIEVGDTPLQVIVAHPPPPRLMGGRMAFDPAASAQLATLAELALQHPPSVLLGDLNMTPRNRMYASFKSAGLVDAFAVAGAGRGWTLPRRLGQTPRFDHGLHRLPLRPVARVDYIWCTPGLHVEKAWLGDDAGSDHLPVIARLVVPT